MTAGDINPSNVVPFGREIQFAIAKELRDMYAALLAEELPESLLLRLKRLDRLTREIPESGK
jgi:hypothetical protein